MLDLLKFLLNICIVRPKTSFASLNKLNSTKKYPPKYIPLYFLFIANLISGLNAALFYENPDIRSYVSLVPTSAITGEGMGNLLALIVEFCQTKLTKRLMYSDELQATVLEVKAIPGLGTTIDVILVNGTLKEGDTMLCAGTDGPIVTQIRSLLMPQPMRELRVKVDKQVHLFRNRIIRFVELPKFTFHSSLECIFG